MIGRAQESATARPVHRASPRLNLAALAGQYSTVIVVVVLAAFFSLTSAYFFSVENLLNILRQMAIVGVLALGMTVVVLIGGIDLSVGSVLLLTGAITGTLVYNYAFNPWLAILIGLAAATLVGSMNGVLVAKAQISPIIVTLGTLIAVRGVGQAVLWLNNSWVWVTDPVFVGIATGQILFIPAITAIMLALYAVVAIALKQTAFGRYVYAVGGNAVAARLSGLPVTRVKIAAYALCGLLAGVAGLIAAARLGIIGPSVGVGLEFETITAVALGGTRLKGGAGRVERTLLGTAVLVMVLNYLTLRGIPDIWQTAVTGFLILAAVLLDRLAQRVSTGANASAREA